jgi:hypothetical protein
MGFNVNLQCFPGREYFGANNTCLRLIIMEPLYVYPECMSRPKLLAALRTVVKLVQVVFLNVICEIGLVCTEVFAHSAAPAKSTIFRPHPH